MKAVSINSISLDFSGVSLIDKPIGEPGPGQLRIRMLKAAVHPSDLNYIRGEYRQGIERLLWNYQELTPTFDVDRNIPHPELPCIPGGEGVGVVDACGEGVDAGRWLGQRVAVTAGPPEGTWQQFVLSTPNQAIPLPAAVPDEQAALMLINPLTALAMVRYVLGIGEGQWVLLSAGNSAVSQLIIKLGRHYGFKTISILRAAPTSHAEAADVVIDTSVQDLRSEVKAATKGRGVAFVIDCVGGGLGEQLASCLTERGRMLLYGTLGGSSMALYSRDLMMTCASISGFYLPAWMGAQTPQQLGEAMQELTRLTGLGLMASQISAQYPLAQAQEAVLASCTPGRQGKILLDLQ